jgi:hypothetical protein
MLAPQLLKVLQTAAHIAAQGPQEGKVAKQ